MRWGPVFLSISCVIFQQIDAYGESRLSAIEGTTKKLTCEAAWAVKDVSQEPLSTVEWTRNGAQIAHYSKGGKGGGKGASWYTASPRLTLDIRTFSLEIADMRSSDQATYRCYVDFRGSSRYPNLDLEDWVDVIVVGLPGKPGRPMITARTSRRISVHWDGSSTHRSAPILRYILNLTDLDRNVSREIRLKNNRTWTVVSELRPWTIYYLTVRGENGAGLGEPSLKSDHFKTDGEPPVGKPSITSVRNTTNTSVLISWLPPPPDTRYGPIIGFTIMAHNMKVTSDSINQYVSNPVVRQYHLTGLEVYSKYMVSLSMDNNYGFSPIDTRIILTDEGVPKTAPIIEKIECTDSHTISVRWARPVQPNGRITRYSIYVWNDAEKRSKFSMEPDRHHARINFAIPNLAPNTKHHIQVSASTIKGEGVSCPIRSITTDVTNPGVPELRDISLHGQNEVRVEWFPPSETSGPVDIYSLKLFPSIASGHPRATYNTTDRHIIIKRIVVEKKYFISVEGVTKSRVFPLKDYPGKPSVREAFVLHRGWEESVKSEKRVQLFTSICNASNPKDETRVCDPDIRFSLGAEEEVPGSGVISLAILSVAGAISILSIAICLFLFFWRRYLSKTSYLYAPPTYSLPGSNSNKPYDHISDDIDHPTILVSAFESHFNKLSRDTGAGFAKEFQELEEWTQSAEKHGDVSSEEASLLSNKPKNRYVNILAYDHSRVKLRAGKSSDYINANYIDGYDKARAYIATQGPLPPTFGDFWRMIWEQKTQVIVMITNTVEKGRKKCDQYWPSENTEIYGNQYQVKLVNENSTGSYCVRMLTIRNLKSSPLGAERVVFHFHYTHWPDHGVPPSPLPVLSFIRKSSGANRPDSGPIVVHCSAGVGRSGTYIVIDSVLREVNERATANIFGFLKHIRRQRNYLVQTEEQYVFCYEAILEAIRSGNTEVCITDLPSYISCLLPQEDQRTGKTLLHLQYELVKESQFESCVAAMSPANQHKNWRGGQIPTDRTRVKLSISPGVEGSDYINATFLPGFRRLNEFIVTQQPMAETKEAFWRMIWEHNCQTIVVISHDDQGVQIGAPSLKFWPEPGTREYFHMDTFLVYCNGFSQVPMESEEKGPFSYPWESYDLLLQSMEDEFQFSCRLVFHPGWSWALPSHAKDLDFENNNRCSVQKTWSLVQHVNETNHGYQNGPLVVIDRGGGTGASAFCILSTLLDQVEEDSAVDVYQITKLCHKRRPGIFASIDDYEWLYQCAAHLLDGEKPRQRPQSGLLSSPKRHSTLISGKKLNGLTNGHCILGKDTTL